jgi:hypothetical protein
MRGEKENLAAQTLNMNVPWNLALDYQRHPVLATTATLGLAESSVLNLSMNTRPNNRYIVKSAQ